MSLSKRKCWYSNNCLHFLKACCSTESFQLNQMLKEKIVYSVILTQERSEQISVFNLNNNHNGSLHYKTFQLHTFVSQCVCYCSSLPPQSDNSWQAQELTCEWLLSGLHCMWEPTSLACIYQARVEVKDNTSLLRYRMNRGRIKFYSTGH